MAVLALFTGFFVGIAFGIHPVTAPPHGRLWRKDAAYGCLIMAACTAVTYLILWWIRAPH